ncbi:MAG: hypothetical protein LBC80_07090 [Treponema sp.]|nr:hypothetical protein [Treponema sp.]
MSDMQVFPLGSGASAYIFANVEEASSILQLLPIEELRNRQTRQMLERTDFIAAAVFPQESGQRFQLAAWGDYPNSRAKMAFRFSKSWKRQRAATGQSYWYSAFSKTSIGMTSRQAFVAVSLSDKPADPHMTGASIPEGFNNFSRGAPFSCWLENPAPMLSRSLNNAGIPIRFPVQQLFFNFYPRTDERYEAMIRLQFENASQTRGMAAILNLAGNFASDDPNTVIAALFFANPPVQSGNNLDIKTGPLSETEVLTLLEMFF